MELERCFIYQKIGNFEGNKKDSPRPFRKTTISPLYLPEKVVFSSFHSNIIILYQWKRSRSVFPLWKARRGRGEALYQKSFLNLNQKREQKFLKSKNRAKNGYDSHRLQWREISHFKKLFKNRKITKYWGWMHISNVKLSVESENGLRSKVRPSI